jgi:GAF domain-containing protein
VSEGPNGHVPRELVDSFGANARLLYSSEDVEDTLLRLCESAVSLIPGCDFASLSLLEQDTIATHGATHPLAERLDRIQYDEHEGPCWEAALEDRIFCSNDITHDSRWPRFSARARKEGGVGALLACRVVDPRSTTRTVGALNIYAERTDAFDDEDAMAAVLLAAVAGGVVDAARRQSELREAMESRDVIGQAMGILMAQHRITSEEAIERLRAASQRLNVRLRDLAMRITASASLVN